MLACTNLWEGNDQELISTIEFHSLAKILNGKETQNTKDCMKNKIAQAENREDSSFPAAWWPPGYRRTTGKYEKTPTPLLQAVRCLYIYAEENIAFARMLLLGYMLY